MSNTSPWPSFDDDSAVLLVVSRYRVAPEGRDQFVDDAERAIDVLAAHTGFLGASIGQSTDEAGLLVIRSEWSGVGAYRRALSSYAVKTERCATAVDSNRRVFGVRGRAQLDRRR